MQATNWIKKKDKSSMTVHITANISLKTVIYSSQTPPISNKNTSFLRLYNKIQGSITPTLRNLNARYHSL